MVMVPVTRCRAGTGDVPLNRDDIATYYPGGKKGYTYYPSMGSGKRGNSPAGYSGTGTGIFNPGREKDRLMPVSFTPLA